MISLILLELASCFAYKLLINKVSRVPRTEVMFWKLSRTTCFGLLCIF